MTYFDYELDNILSPHVFIAMSDLGYNTTYSTELNNWLDANCKKGEYMIVHFNAGECIHGSRIPIEENGFVVFFDYKEEAMAFKLRWS